MIHVERGHRSGSAFGLEGERKATLHRCIMASSVVWTGYADDEPICMWGLVPPTLLSASAYLWLLTTEQIKDHQFALVRHSQIEMEKMLEAYPLIVGHCDLRHPNSVRWLKWLGAVFDTSQGPMAPFMIEKKNG
jgi:hypothetical protein